MKMLGKLGAQILQLIGKDLNTRNFNLVLNNSCHLSYSISCGVRHKVQQNFLRIKHFYHTFCISKNIKHSRR